MRPLLLASALFTACWNPVHADAVDALGPEAPGIPRGELHRAGQPCTTCHSGSGPGSPEFSVAGTIYRRRGILDPLEGAEVHVTDAQNVTRIATTNVVGNFYIEKSAWNPAFPLSVVVKYPGIGDRAMETKINRDAGCAACHRGNGDNARMPAVYMVE